MRTDKKNIVIGIFILSLITVIAYFTLGNNDYVFRVKNHDREELYRPLWRNKDNIILLKTTQNTDGTTQILNFDIQAQKVKKITEFEQMFKVTMTEIMHINQNGDKILVDLEGKPKVINFANDNQVEINTIDFLADFSFIKMSNNGRYIIGLGYNEKEQYGIGMFDTKQMEGNFYPQKDINKEISTAINVKNDGEILFQGQDKNIYKLSLKNNSINCSNIFAYNEELINLKISPGNQNLISGLSSEDNGWKIIIFDLSNNDINDYIIESYIRPNYSWSSNDKLVIRTSLSNKNSYIYILDYAKKELERIKKFKKTYVGEVAFSPTNDKIVYNVNTEKIDILSLE